MHAYIYIYILVAKVWEPLAMYYFIPGKLWYNTYYSMALHFFPSWLYYLFRPLYQVFAFMTIKACYCTIFTTGPFFTSLMMALVHHWKFPIAQSWTDKNASTEVVLLKNFGRTAMYSTYNALTICVLAA